MRLAGLRFRVASSLAIIACAGVFVAHARQGSGLPDPGVYAETRAGNVPLKETLAGTALSGIPSGSRDAMVFPIGSVERVPTVSDLAAFVMNIPTVQDTAAAGAQMRFCVGEHVREPDYQTMQVMVGKFRVGMYRFSSPQLTRDWMAKAYAKMSNSRKWKDKHPPAVVGLIVNGEMYPVRIDDAWLTGNP